MRTAGDDIAEVLALIGVRPVWDEASRRVTDLTVIPLEELGRPRIDVTVRISGFFRDAFPHVVTMLDDAVQLVAASTSRTSRTTSGRTRRPTWPSTATTGEPPPGSSAPSPGAYGAGMLQLIESGNWRDDADLAEVYTAWGGFAYGRGLDGSAGPRRHGGQLPADQRGGQEHRHPRARHRRLRRLLPVPRRHGRHRPRADRHRAAGLHRRLAPAPDAVRTRSLSEETARVFRARVVNPRWITAMRRHGYKGAFELAATVDYLFGYDATAGVVTDWMYETLARTYALDEENQAFLKHANPWALRGIIERLTEAADRGLWAAADPDLLAELAQVYLDVEGDLEDDAG